ncbi:MAG TPA: sigma-70 family RNA polymerase sigma factor [Polyangia bacterium]|nr:sigma-70 family RNA polymerase sigma factor [Polyangia bacterium]
MAYLRDLRRHPVMTRAEEHEVATKYAETHDPRLASKLVQANLRLVVKIAFEYRTSRANLLDLVQEGNLGLVHAVQKYDPKRGVRLATYASWWMRAYMLKYILSSARLVKLGTTQAQRRLFFGLRRERARLAGLEGGTVDTQTLAARLDVSEKEVVEMDRRLAAREASLDAASYQMGDGLSRSDAFVAEETRRPDVQCETVEFNEAFLRSVHDFRETLKGRDVVIFDGRLSGEDTATFAEIAQQFGVSRERVRQLEEHLKTRLRRHLAATLGDAVPFEAAAA